MRAASWVGENRTRYASQQRQPPLHHQNTQGRKANANPVGAGQGDRSQPIHGGLEGQQGIVAREAVVETAHNSHGPNAKQQAGSHKALGKAATAPYPSLEPVAQDGETLLDLPPFPQQPPRYHDQQGQNNAVNGARLNIRQTAGHRHPNHHGHQPHRLGDNLLHCLGQVTAQQEPYSRAKHNGSNVDPGAAGFGPQTEHRESSSRVRGISVGRLTKNTGVRSQNSVPA